MNEKKKLSGKALLERVQGFLEENEDLVGELKVTKREGKGATIFMIRCTALGKLVDMLEEEMVAAALQNQHDVISVVLNFTFKHGKLSQIKQRDRDGMEIDVLHGLESYELKTSKNLHQSEIPGFISEYFEEMVESQGIKGTWWLVFFQQRTDAKDKIGEVCLYYLVVIEIPTYNLDYPDKKTITKEVMKLVQKAEKKVLKEDGISEDEGILVPVDNILVVDSLRKKVKKLKREKEESIKKLEREKEESIKKLEREKEEAINKIQQLEEELDKLRSKNK
jgi:hypothetical protein